MLPFRRHPLQHAIFEQFRASGGGEQQQPQPNGSQQQQPMQNKQQQGNPNDPNNQQNNQQQNNQQQNDQQQQDKNKSPLSEFAGLWDDAPAPKDGEQAQPDWNNHESIVPEMNIDPKKLYESAKKIDFSKVMNPEKVAAALKGDSAAFMEVINTVAQATFANMAMTSSKMMKAMQKQMAEKLYSGALPHHFRSHQVSNQIDADNPIFTDPAVSPMLDLAKKQMQVKYPKASATEISAMAKKMIAGLVTAAGGKLEDTSAANNSRTQQRKPKGGLNSNGVDGDMDWLDFAGVPTESK